MFSIVKELIGVLGSVLVLISMGFNTNEDKGVWWMRLFNLVGSAVFVVYGALIHSISVTLLNLICIILNAKGLYNITRKIKKK